MNIKDVVNLRAPLTLSTDSTEQDFPVVQGRFWLKQRGGKVFFFSHKLSLEDQGK